MRVNTSYNNFARGQIDHDLDGRYDLPVYTSGARVFENCISNFKGNAIYRSGLENIVDFQDCALIEFKFSQNQNYILILFANKMRFMSYDVNDVFGFVLDSGGPAVLEIDTPWTLAESKEIAFSKAYTQNFDSMIICHKDHEPQELIRIAADDFKINPFARKDDPFPLTHEASKVITAITQAVEPTVSVAVHGYSVGDRVRITGVVGMTEINDWTVAILTVPGAGTFTIDLDTTDFTAYGSAGITEKVLTGDFPALPLYYKGRLYFGATRLKITTIFASEAGDFKIFTLPVTVLDESALQFTVAEFTSRIEWLFPGQNSLIAGSNDIIVAINGGSVGAPITAESIDTISTSADGANNVAPLTKDGFIFYISNDGRNMLYFSFDLLTETFVAPDANILAYDVTKGGITKIRFVKTRENLIFGLLPDGGLVSCNFNQSESIIGWHTHTTNGDIKDIAQISDNNGTQQLFTLSLRDSVFYIERQAEYIEFSKRTDDVFFTDEDSEVADDEAFYRKIAEELKDVIFLDNSSTFSNLQITTITFASGPGTITDASGPFVAGDVGKHIVYRTITGAESGRFEITAFNSATEVDVDVLQTPTTNTFSSWYLTFDTVSGLSRFNGFSVGVVADGGFLDDFVVSGGQISLGTQATHVVIGYKYRGVISSFSLGFQARGENTQATMKSIYRVGLRMRNTAGVQFGSTPYRMVPIQQLRQGDLNYLPPLPINITEYISYSDDNMLDKEFFVVQDDPLPMTITSVIVEANYTFTK